MGVGMSEKIGCWLVARDFEDFRTDSVWKKKTATRSSSRSRSRSSSRSSSRAVRLFNLYLFITIFTPLYVHLK